MLIRLKPMTHFYNVWMLQLAEDCAFRDCSLDVTVKGTVRNTLKGQYGRHRRRTRS